METAEQEIEEEFRFDPVQMRRNILPRGVRKVRVELAPDADIVEFYEKLTAESDAPSYQAQINQILREAMARLQEGGKSEVPVRKIA